MAETTVFQGFNVPRQLRKCYKSVAESVVFEKGTLLDGNDHFR
jgi:hypothetical protein